MDGAKITVCGLFILFTQTALGMSPTEYWTKKYQRAPSTNTSTERIEKLKAPSAEKLSLVIPSFVVHGIKPTREAYTVMPRKMDEGGNTVVTPGLGLEYKMEGGLMLMAAMVKDCYDNLAGTFQIGKLYEIDDRSNFGWSVGVYARQTPFACEVKQTGPYTRTDCYQLDSYSWKFMGSVDGQSVDIIPMPFLHFSTALYKSRQFQLDFKIMTNVVLNEVGFGIPF
ncbi:hypothetical protein D3C87_377770 [compost metagenome]